MNGLALDILNGVARDIEREWDRRGGNMSYFVGLVKGARLTPKDLDWYLAEHGDTCPECVNKVFAAIVYPAVLNGEYTPTPTNKEGGER